MGLASAVMGFRPIGRGRIGGVAFTLALVVETTAAAAAAAPSTVRLESVIPPI
jgi:hypothetical protein